VTHVGVERLTTGDHEEDGAQCEERLHGRFGEEVHRVDRVHGLEHAGILEKLSEPEHTEDREPHHHHRTEDASDAGGSPFLHEKEHGEDGHGDGDDEVVQGGGGLLHALDGAQHRDGRRDEPVAVEQRRAEDTETHHDATAAFQGALGHDHRGEGQDSPLSVIVGLHHEGQVLDGDDDHEGPNGQGCMSPYTIPNAPRARAPMPALWPPCCPSPDWSLADVGESTDPLESLDDSCSKVTSRC